MQITSFIHSKWLVRKRFLISAAALTLFLIAEFSVRLLGFVNFPLYDADAKIGYVPKPSQAGAFMNQNSWQFNSLGMGSPEFAPSQGRDILLVGDSVVFGGNPYRQEDRLGPQLAKQGIGAVWPIAAGSWALRNELAWLRQHPGIVDMVEDVVFVLNSGDFAEASSWSCELTHPRSHPSLALLYLFKKYVNSLGECEAPAAAELQVPPGDVAAELRFFAASRDNDILVVLYPDLEEMNDSLLRSSRVNEQKYFLMKAGVKQVVDVANNPRWSTQYYRDGIHPTVQGTRVLATIIAAQLSNRSNSQ